MHEIYMNNAATAWPKAPGVGDAISATLAVIPPAAGRSNYGNTDPLNDVRQALAEMLVVNEPENIILCAGATLGLNMIFHGLCREGHGVVVTTAAEHNSVLRPLSLLEKGGMIKLVIVPVDQTGRALPRAWEEALKKHNPRLAVMTHSSNVTGSVHDVREYFKAAKEAGAVTLLDASQTIGFLPVNADLLKADIIAFTGHKYMLGPPGSGGFYISPEVCLEPLLVGGTGVRSDLESMPPELPARLEAGTPNEPAFAGLLQALRWQQETPPDADSVVKKVMLLEDELLRLGAKVVLPGLPRTPIISFVLPGISVEETGYLLEKSFNIRCRTGLHCAPLIHACLGTAPEGTVRISLSRFTTGTELEHFVQAIQNIMAVLSK